jgi:signal transduction histidine kinase
VKRGIAARFAFMLAAAAVVPLLAYGAVSITSLSASAEQTVTQGHVDVARRAAREIEIYVTSSVRILNAVAADLQDTNLQAWQQERILRNYVLQFPEFSELALVDSTGAPRVTSRLVPSAVVVPGEDARLVEGARMSSFTIDDDLLPTAVVATRPSSERDEWLVGRVQLEQLWRTVDAIRIGTQGFALVATRDGQLLAHGDPDEKSRVARGDDMSAHPLLARLKAAGPEQAVSAEYEGPRGATVGAGVALPSLGWSIIVEQPRDEAFAVPLRTSRQLWVAIGAALLLMLSVGYFWGRSFINPILRLTRGTRALAAGRLDERVEVDSTDELGQLGSAFNNMADNLVRLQDEVRRQERQATFGLVAAGLVHDLAHPIQNLGNSCRLIVRAFDDPEYRASFQRTVDRELLQVKNVLEDLRELSPRPVPKVRVPVDLNVVASGIVESMQSGADTAGVTLELELSPVPLIIRSDAYGLSRVCRNLLVNGFQATAPGQWVRVRTTQRDRMAIIEVADSGSGIPPERLATLFDGHTTKQRGLGFGLMTSKSIVEQLGGQITVTSTVGVGTTFQLLFPLEGTGTLPVTASRVPGTPPSLGGAAAAAASR